MTNIVCSFCNRPQSDTRTLIKSSINDNTYICNKCIDKSSKILNKTLKKKSINSYSPKEIKKYMDDYIIKQDNAKKIIATAIYNHYKRITLDLDIQKSNILLIGSSGVGKTLIAKTIAEILDIPFTIADATTLTEAGYVGDDVESILKRLIINADGDISKAEKGLIVLDEIDKITKKGENVSITRDVSGEGVQQALLKMIEGTTANVVMEGARKNPYADTIPINTENILFIFSGAFVGLDNIIKKRLNIEQKSIGFNTEITKSKSENKILKPNTEDLIKYGLIPELVGRIPIVACLEDLDENDLINILTDTKNNLIQQYQTLFDLDDVKLHFTKEALKEIANVSVKKKLGARGLKSILEEILNDYMFEGPDLENKDLKITKQIVINKLKNF